MKKLLLTVAIAIVATLMLAFAVSADSVHNANTVDYNETVTLSDGTVLPLFDENNEALIWYISGKDGDKNVYSSILAQDSQVKWYTESWNEVTGFGINFDDGTKIENNNVVVVNIMDDDVVKNHGPGTDHYGKHITGFKYVFQGWKNIEYIYLRLDTGGIYRQSFNGCSKLKYVNIEDLTNLSRLGDSQHFSNCTEFFKGQTLDLSRTKLTSIDGGGSFNNTRIEKIIFPSTLTVISSWTFQSTTFTTFSWPRTVTKMEGSMFKNNSSLEQICIYSSLNAIQESAFSGCSSLERICFVGTKEQLETLITNTSATGNDAFFAVVGENNANVIAYEDYLKLEDKSGKYAIYNYSYCEAFNDGVHTAVDGADDCTKDAACSVCVVPIKAEYTEHNYLETLVYPNGFASAGVYTYVCQNRTFCTCGNKNEATSPIFVAGPGFSTKENANDGISGGYSVDLDALEEYNRVNKDSKISFGIMIVNPNYLAGKDSFLDANGAVNAEKGFIQTDMTSTEYSNVSISLTGFTGAQDISLVIALYAITEDGEVQFVQSQTTACADKNVTIGDTTLYTVTFDSVKNGNTTVGNLGDYVMPTPKEEEIA